VEAHAHEGQPSEVPPCVQAGYSDRSRQTECGSYAGNFGKHPAPSRAQKVRPNINYVVIVEKGETSYGAYVPDLPGCVAVGETHDEVLRLIREAIEFHLEGLKEDQLPVPTPSSVIETVRLGAE
jgi:predicted RNase H-like HicB family nuclease